MDTNSLINELNQNKNENSKKCCDYQPKPGEITSSSPEFWGPRIWFILFFFIYKVNTQEQLQKVYIIIKDLNEILPCPICSNHVVEYIKREPLLTLDNIKYTNDEINKIKNKLFLWLLKLQNIIRYNKKKEIYKYTLESLKDYYEKVKANENIFRNVYIVLTSHFTKNNAIKPVVAKWMKNVEELKNEFVK